MVRGHTTVASSSIIGPLLAVHTLRASSKTVVVVYFAGSLASFRFCCCLLLFLFCGGLSLVMISLHPSIKLQSDLRGGILHPLPLTIFTPIRFSAILYYVSTTYKSLFLTTNLLSRRNNGVSRKEKQMEFRSTECHEDESSPR